MAAAAGRYEDALRVANEWHDAPDLDSFPSLVLEGLSGLVEADAVGWNEFNPSGLRLFALPDDGLTDGAPVIERFAHQHPLIGRLFADPLMPPIAISDFCSRRELHRLDLYHEFLRHWQIEHQLGFGISAGSFVGIAFNRSTRDFTQDERTFLGLVRPHIVAAYAAVRTRLEARRRAERLERALRETGREIVLLDRRGRIEHASARARRLLRGQDIDSVVQLELETAEGRVVVRRVEDDPPTLLIDEDRRPRLDDERAAAFRLTRRETEILSLVALGHTSELIATSLSLSARTVDKHVEHALAKLDVGSRREAVALLLAEPPD